MSVGGGTRSVSIPTERKHYPKTEKKMKQNYYIIMYQPFCQQKTMNVRFAIDFKQRSL